MSDFFIPASPNGIETNIAQLEHLIEPTDYDHQILHAAAVTGENARATKIFHKFPRFLQRKEFPDYHSPSVTGIFRLCPVKTASRN